MKAKNIIAVDKDGKTLYSMPCSPDPSDVAYRVFEHACKRRGIKDYVVMLEVY